MTFILVKFNLPEKSSVKYKVWDVAQFVMELLFINARVFRNITFCVSRDAVFPGIIIS